VACDFYVDGVERASEIPGGWRMDSILNIDHHAPNQKMYGFTTSTQLACDYIRAFGPVPPHWLIVANHLDADAFLALMILMGRIKPEGRYIQAAVAADHTGEPDQIGDLLNAIADLRDVDLGQRSLAALAADRPFEGAVEKKLQHRYGERMRVAELIEDGTFRFQDGIAYATLDAPVDDMAMLVPLLPKSKLIVIFSSLGPETYLVKMRLGLAAPMNMNLHTLKIQTFDPIFGGHAGAGTNKRGGGTNIPPEQYLDLLERKVTDFKS